MVVEEELLRREERRESKAVSLSDSEDAEDEDNVVPAADVVDDCEYSDDATDWREREGGRLCGTFANCVDAGRSGLDPMVAAPVAAAPLFVVWVVWVCKQ